MTLHITNTEYIPDYDLWYDSGYIECDLCGRCTETVGADFWPDVTAGWARIQLANLDECDQCVAQNLAGAQ